MKDATINLIRSITGFLIAPLVIPAVMVVGFFIFNHLGVTEIIPAHTFQESVIWGIFVMCIGYVLTLIAAVPGHIWFLRRGWHDWWMYALLGAAIGSAPFLWKALDLLMSYP